jgi:hypothetical protein
MLIYRSKSFLQHVITALFLCTEKLHLYKQAILFTAEVRHTQGQSSCGRVRDAARNRCVLKEALF